MKILNVISLGAGVQSSVMALMAAHGELPRPDCAIFADTQWEPQGVYDHLDWLESVVTNPLLVNNTFPIYRVTKGNIRQAMIDGRGMNGDRFSSVPFFTSANGKSTMGQRSCTVEYKIAPIRKKIRSLLGIKYRKKVPKGVIVNQWIGISTDEASRMKPAREKWLINTWPLIDAGMSRQDCKQWFKERYPDRVLSKSACIGCPFHNTAGWRDMKMNDPKSFADAVEVDIAIRDNGKNGNKQYMHTSLKALSEVDFRNLEDKGQINMFENECEGMCGV
mgnify:FL=1|tara:strand:+ start:33 stop:863 length:831 start_codon:yes stop_codon:yes gene_type:complete